MVTNEACQEGGIAVAVHGGRDTTNRSCVVMTALGPYIVLVEPSSDTEDQDDACSSICLQGPDVFRSKSAGRPQSHIPAR